MIRQSINDEIVRDAFNHLRSAFTDDVVRRMKAQELQGVAEREASIRFALDHELEKWASSMRDEPLNDVVNRVMRDTWGKPVDKV